jgi:hypothetical protein
VGGEPDDPRRYRHPDAEYEADPLPFGRPHVMLRIGGCGNERD